jgi:ABC-type nitrate/sulfonate/bicarbonate transport system permease component
MVVVWEIAGLIIGPFFLPRFSDVAGSILATLTNGDLLTVIGSLRQMLLGFGIASVIGIFLGLLLGSSRLAETVLGMYINALYVTSLEALLPFIILLFGTKLPYRVGGCAILRLFHHNQHNGRYPLR